MAIYSDFHIIKTTAWVPTKFCTPIKTTKIFFVGCPKTQQRNPDARRPPSWKLKNYGISASTLPILKKLARWCIWDPRNSLAIKINAIWKSKMVVDLYIKISKNRDISATVLPILVKFGKVMHLGSLDVASHSDSRNLNIQDGRRPPSWKMETVRYLSNSLTDVNDIRHGNFRHSTYDLLFTFHRNCLSNRF